MQNLMDGRLINFSMGGGRGQAECDGFYGWLVDRVGFITPFSMMTMKGRTINTPLPRPQMDGWVPKEDMYLTDPPEIYILLYTPNCFCRRVGAKNLDIEGISLTFLDEPQKYILQKRGSRRALSGGVGLKKTQRNGRV